MKQKLIIIAIAIILMFTSAITSYAVTETSIVLQSNKTEVKAGETFTVTLKATCPDGINGIDTAYEYDKEKLELTTANVTSSDLASLGVDNQITVISNTTESIQSVDFYALTFTVKEDVEVGSVAKVSITETLLDSDAATNSEHTIPAQEISITIIEELEVPGTGDEGTNDDLDDGTDDENTGDNTTENEEPAPTPGDDDKDNDSTNAIKPETGKDSTTITNDIPKAGLNSMIIFCILAVIVIAIVIYKKNIKYRDII